ncbi:YgaP family membrane protein [Rhodovulum sp. DZ06]|uniref:YgaP family membrane protein n=1 Tax=Rhodovulum sp. DZ06 TaxID=3425126 RepID=UPI003D327696
MNIDRIVLAFAGVVVLAGLALGTLATPWGYALSAFVGLNLLQSAFTGFCPLAIILKKLQVRPGPAFD